MNAEGGEKSQSSVHKSCLSSSGWIDITLPIQTGMVHWPGDPSIRIRRIREIRKGDSCNLSAISMSLHTGTHIDAPLHFLDQGISIDKIPLSVGIGPARAIEITDPESIKPEELRVHKIRRGERILFKTQNSYNALKSNRFVKNFVALSLEASQFLAKRKVKIIGIDYFSIGPYRDKSDEVHRTLLKAGVWIIEGLDLSKVKPGKYDLICLPIKITGADGAPARVLIRK